MTHNHHKKSKQKSEEAPVMEKKAKSCKVNARIEDSAILLWKESHNSSDSSFTFASGNDSLMTDSICSEGQEKKTRLNGKSKRTNTIAITDSDIG